MIRMRFPWRTAVTCLLALGAAAAAMAQTPPRTPLFGYADASGRMIVEPAYSAVSVFVGGNWVAVATRSKSGFINLRTGASTGLIFDGTVAGTEAIPLFAAGPEPVALGGKWGFADETGRIVLRAIYDNAGRFATEGLAVVTLAGRRGFIDRRGRFTNPGDYGEIRNFQNGMAAVRRGDRWGAIDRRGRLAVPIRFGFLGPFARNGLAAATEDAGPGPKARFGFVDRSGRFAIPPVYASTFGFVEPYAEVDRLAPPGLARVVTREADGSERVGYIDRSGRLATHLPPGLNGWHVSLNGLIQVQDSKTSKWGFANSSGRLVIPAEFDSTGGFGPNGLAPAALAGKWGYIRTDGRFAIDPSFDSAAMFDARGRAQVWQGRKSWLIDGANRMLAAFPVWKAWPIGSTDYAPILYYPPQFDYPVQQFGRWKLERTLYAVEDFSRVPTATARVRLSMLSEDGLVAWTVETEGFTLDIRTEIGAGHGDRTDIDSLDVMPVGAIGLLDRFRRQAEGQSGSSLAFSRPEPARSEQMSRLRMIEGRRTEYRRQMDQSRDDLERAWAAMRVAVAEQFGGLSGRPCMPPQCLY